MEAKSVTSAIEMMHDCDFYIDDTAAISPVELRAKARRMKRSSGIDVIMVDYLQLMSIPRYSENRVNEIAEVTRSLKALAMVKKVNGSLLLSKDLFKSLCDISLSWTG